MLIIYIYIYILAESQWVEFKEGTMSIGASMS